MSPGSIFARQPADLYRRQFEIVSRSRRVKAKREVGLETELLKSRQILRKARSLRKTGSSAETKTKGPAML